jgi:hypothetical protein
MSANLETTRQRLLDRIANPMQGDDTAAFQAALDRLPPAPAPAQPKVQRKARTASSKPAPYVALDDLFGAQTWNWLPTYARPDRVAIGTCQCGETIFEADSTLGGVAEVVRDGQHVLVHFDCMLPGESQA